MVKYGRMKLYKNLFINQYFDDFNCRDGDEDEDEEPDNCAAPLTCKEKDLLRYYYYIHNGIATKYVAGTSSILSSTRS